MSQHMHSYVHQKTPSRMLMAARFVIIPNLKLYPNTFPQDNVISTLWAIPPMGYYITKEVNALLL